MKRVSNNVLGSSVYSVSGRVGYQRRKEIFV